MTKNPDVKKPPVVFDPAETKPMRVAKPGEKVRALDRVWLVLSSHEERRMIVGQTCDDHPQLPKQSKKFSADEVVEILAAG